MNRGEVWLAEVGPKQRPVLVLARDEALDVRALVTVAEVSTTMRGLAVEVEIDHTGIGLRTNSVVNCDGLHTVAQTALTRRVGATDGTTTERVCAAISCALGC